MRGRVAGTQVFVARSRPKTHHGKNHIQHINQAHPRVNPWKNRFEYLWSYFLLTKILISPIATPPHIMRIAIMGILTQNHITPAQAHKAQPSQVLASNKRRRKKVRSMQREYRKIKVLQYNRVQNEWETKNYQKNMRLCNFYYKIISSHQALHHLPSLIR